MVHEVLRSPGQPLDAEARAYFEPRFGFDFSRVHIHTDQTAVASAQAINARAYALGPDVVFAAGQYAPATASGRRLLAHELAHVAAGERRTEPRIVRRAPTSTETPAATSPAPQEVLDDPVVRDYIELVWDKSWGHKPFDSGMGSDDLSSLPEPNEPVNDLSNPPQPNEAKNDQSVVPDPRMGASYREGKYEGKTFREAWFFVGADGKPVNSWGRDGDGEIRDDQVIHYSRFPVDIKKEDYKVPAGARAFVHTHPTQQHAMQSEEGATLVVEGQLAEDEIGVDVLKMPVYAVAKKDVLKTYQTPSGQLSTERFSRSKLTKEK